MAPKLNMHRNTVYGHPEWAKHKSPWRHGRQMLSIFSSGIIVSLAPPVILSTVASAFVTLINYGVLERRLASWVPKFQIDIMPFSLLAPVLALLLVFRTNASYQRFDEARKVWGSNVNRSRDLARQVHSLGPAFHCQNCVQVPWSFWNFDRIACNYLVAHRDFDRIACKCPVSHRDDDRIDCNCPASQPDFQRFVRKCSGISTDLLAIALFSIEFIHRIFLEFACNLPRFPSNFPRLCCNCSSQVFQF